MKSMRARIACGVGGLLLLLIACCVVMRVGSLPASRVDGAAAGRPSGLIPAGTRPGATATKWTLVAMVAAGAGIAGYLCVSVYANLRRDAASLRAGILALAGDPQAVEMPKLAYGELNDCAAAVLTVARRLSAQMTKLSEEAFQDPLTSLPNRRVFRDMLARQVAFALRTHQPLSVVMVDLDHFKLLNDRYGHQAGDVVLRHAAGRLASLVRASDVVARLGGEEFAILLPGADLSEAMRLAHDLRDALRSDTVADGERELRVTASFGVAELHASGIRDPGMLLQQADVALYEAKGAGRDRVVAARRSADAGCSEAGGSPVTAAEFSCRGAAATGSRDQQGASGADTFALMGCTFSFLRAMPDRQRVARDLLQQVATVLQCRCASLLLLDETGRSFDPVAIIGTCGGQPSADTPVPPELCRWLAEKRMGESRRGVETADRGLFHLTDPDNGEAVVYLPLAVYEEVLGVVKAAGLPADTDLSGSRYAVVQAICAIGATAIRNCDLYSRLEDRVLGSIKALAGAVEAALPRKQGHATRVSDLAVEIAQAMGQRNQEALRSLRFAALLHDIGELTVPRGILETRRGLRKRDREVLQGHAAAGAAILEGIPELRNLAGIVRHHHEHHDGSGYPDGLAGTEIPFESAVIAVADAYDTMVSGRRDGRALPHFAALKRILEGSGTRFAPSVVAALLKCHKAAQAMQHGSVPSDQETAPAPAAVVA